MKTISSQLFLIAVSFVCFGLAAQDSQAQIFGRFRGSAKQATCPTGGCPTVTNSQQGHWSYPGAIESHLESTHGVNSNGMTASQKLNLHDAIHTGKASSASIAATKTIELKATVVTSDRSAEIASVASERRKFHRVLMAAARNARDEGKITAFQLAALSVMSRAPASMDKIQAVIHETATEEGLATTTAIDWDSLIGFIERLIPLIIQLIGMFG